MRRKSATGGGRRRRRRRAQPRAGQRSAAMSGRTRGSGGPSEESRGWPHSVPWRLGGFFFLLLLEGAGCLASPSSSISGVNNNNNNNNNPSVNIYMSVEEVKKLLGLDAELYYVRDDVVNHYALSFTLPVPSETNSLHFTWHSKTKVDYRLGFQVENPVAMNQPRSNISNQGEVPHVPSGWSNALMN